jgi:hypothetical protein
MRAETFTTLEILKKEYPNNIIVLFKGKYYVI